MFTVKLPSPRSKRKSSKSASATPCFSFPTLVNEGEGVLSRKCIVGVLRPDGVEIDDTEHNFHRRGFFGKRVSSHERSEEAKEDLLILSFEEAFFLCYALGCLVIKDEQNMLNVEQFWQKLLLLNSCSKEGAPPFPALYAAYHHFRSKGWVVKPGVKFGAHFVLYKEGPPYNHATYSVRVLHGMQACAAPSWKLLAALNRTTVNAGKHILLCYVLIPKDACDFSLPTCIEQFQVQEMLVTRWVGAAERAE